MSHFTSIELTIKDEASLLAALSELGFEGRVERHDTPQTLYGYHGDARPEQADVIIRRAHIGRSSNDIGFARQTDGTWRAIISEYDARIGYGTAWQQKVAQLAGVHAATAEARRRGYQVSRQAEGTRIRLVLSR